MYFILILVLVSKVGLSICAQKNVPVLLSNAVTCPVTKYTDFVTGDSVDIRIESPVYINFVTSEPSFLWNITEEIDKNQTKTYFARATIKYVFEELTGNWKIDVYRNKDTDVNDPHCYLGHNYSQTSCVIEVVIGKRFEEAPTTFYVLSGIIVVCILAMITETVLFITYINKVKKSQHGKIFKLEEEVDSVRYSKTPSAKKSCQIADGPDGNLYECLENVQISDTKSPPPLPPLPTSEAKMKLLGTSSLNSTLEKPSKERQSATNPRIRPRIPTPVQSSYDSDEGEMYEAPPDYRKSYTLPPRGTEGLDKKALFNALLAKQLPAPGTSASPHRTNTMEENRKRRPPLPPPAHRKHNENFHQPSSSRMNLIESAKPIAKIPPPKAADKTKNNNVASELQAALQRRRNVSQDLSPQEPMKNLSAPSNARQPQIKQSEKPPQAKPPAKPKNVSIPAPQIRDIPSHQTPPDVNDDDDEWVYEPLAPYNIYSV